MIADGQVTAGNTVAVDHLRAVPARASGRPDPALSGQAVSAPGGLTSVDRLRGLLNASRMIGGDLDLPVVLRRIVEAALQLLRARYGALGVLAPDGGLEQFIYVGVDSQTADRIGRLPSGKGLVGALVEDARPIRLRHIADDPRSVGFPENHPVMNGFLGVPVRVRGEVFGTLYVTEPESAEFTEEDEDLVASFAAVAGVAIENARMLAQAQRRQEWLAASAEITRQLLATTGEDPLQLIARKVQEVAGADVASVVLPTADGRRLMVQVAYGQGSDELTGYTYPIENSLASLAFQTGRPVLVGDITETTWFVHLRHAVPVGPVMVLPLVGASRMRGALIAGRLAGRSRFDEAELDMATTFANHAALALELADARADQQRMMLLEDRDRIARDLHDHVVQRLFGAGLSIQAEASTAPSAEQSARLDHIVDELDETIRQIRTTIFQLRGPLASKNANLRARMLDIVAESTRLLGFEPAVRFTGPIDIVVPDDVVNDVLAVTREGLSNTARHAGATRVAVELEATGGALTLSITDDGVGPGNTPRRSGLANLAERAECHGGQFTVSAARPEGDTATNQLPNRRGTRLLWTIPLK